MTDAENDVGVDGFRLALKIGRMCQDVHAHGSTVMFAIAAVAAYGINTQRDKQYSVEETLALHMQTIVAIMSGKFNDLKEKAKENGNNPASDK